MIHIFLALLPLILFFGGLIVALNVWYYQMTMPEERRHDWESDQS